MQAVRFGISDMERLLQKAIETGSDAELVEAINRLDAKISYTFWILLTIIIGLFVVNSIRFYNIEKRLKIEEQR